MFPGKPTIDVITHPASVPKTADVTNWQGGGGKEVTIFTGQAAGPNVPYKGKKRKTPTQHRETAPNRYSSAGRARAGGGVVLRGNQVVGSPGPHYLQKSPAAGAYSQTPAPRGAILFSVSSKNECGEEPNHTQKPLTP